MKTQVSTALPTEYMLELLAFAHLLGEKWHLSAVSIFMHLSMNEVGYLSYV